MSAPRVSEAGDDFEDDFDDVPQTHLDDEAYEAFLERELDAQGNVRGPVPVTRILVILIVLALAIAVVALR